MGHAGTVLGSRCCLATPAVLGGLLNCVSLWTVSGYRLLVCLGWGVGGVFYAFSRVLYCSIMANISRRPSNVLHAAELVRLNLKADTMARSAGVAVRLLRVPFLSGKWHNSCGDVCC